MNSNINTLKKAWKDPVLSQVISVGIVAILTSIYGVINSLITKKSLTDEFISIWTYKFELWFIPILLLMVYCILHFAHRKFKYDEETLTLDRKLFDDIRNRPMMEEFVLEMKSNGFSSRPVPMDAIGAMIDFLEDSKRSEFEFLNPRLNKLKNQLIIASEELNSVSSNYVCGTNLAGWVALPSEWEYNDLPRFNAAKSIIKPLEKEFSEAYQEFISQGRRILKA